MVAKKTGCPVLDKKTNCPILGQAKDCPYLYKLKDCPVFGKAKGCPLLMKYCPFPNISTCPYFKKVLESKLSAFAVFVYL
jgi:hypothetical protein